MEKSEGSLRRKSMNPVSPLFEKIDASIEKKANLFENSFSRYAVRAVLACLFLTLGTAVAFAIAMKGEDIAHGLGKILYAFMFSWGLVMILYMNAELGTSNMLYMTVGVFRQRLALSKAAKILFACIFFQYDWRYIMWISNFYDYAISRFNVGQLYVRINSSKTSKTFSNDFGGRDVCEYRCQYRCTDQHADERGCRKSDHSRIHHFHFCFFRI